MDFSWDDEQQAFRSTVRAFLAANLPRDWESLAHGPGSESQSTFSKTFCGALAKAGLLVPHWPKRWGGRDADPWTAFILAEEMWEAGEPRGGQYMNVNWIGPTLMRFGSEEQQAALHPADGRGETIWCQGFSEPEAGSDLASLRTRAEQGRVRFTASTARRSGLPMPGDADTCFLLARTSPGADGISIFLVPMDTPGITVRQIPSVIGEGDIHEVFFDDVEVPATAMLGAEGKGWEIVRTALSLERVGIPRFALAARMLHRAVDRLKKAGRFGAGAIEQAARARAACEAARLYSYNIVDQRRHGIATGPEASAARFATVNAERLVGRVRRRACARSTGGRRSDAARASSARDRGRHRIGRRRNSAQSDRHRIAQDCHESRADGFHDSHPTRTSLVAAIDKLADAVPAEADGVSWLRARRATSWSRSCMEGEYFDIAPGARTRSAVCGDGGRATGASAVHGRDCAVDAGAPAPSG